MAVLTAVVTVAVIAAVPVVAAAPVAATASGAMASTGAGGGIAIATEAASVAISLGPIGWIALGAEEQGDKVTWDCWKPVLREFSATDSQGRLLKDLLLDERIKQVKVINISEEGNIDKLPTLIIKNAWDEEFLITYVHLPWNQLAAHATPL